VLLSKTGRFIVHYEKWTHELAADRHVVLAVRDLDRPCSALDVLNSAIQVILVTIPYSLLSMSDELQSWFKFQSGLTVHCLLLAAARHFRFDLLYGSEGCQSVILEGRRLS
jgi:hypothetical protein